MLLFCFTILYFEKCDSKSDRVLLRDIEVLTLTKGKYTTGHRTKRILQLQCVGGTARCKNTPQTVQCYNRGWDGNDIQWECKSNLDNRYSFGQLEVLCEGYDHQDDSYVLAGSCGLEYTLNVDNTHQPFHEYIKTRSTSYGSLFSFVAIVAIVFFACYTFGTKNTSAYRSAPPPAGFRPDLFGYPSDSSTYYQSDSSSSSGPGFWTGLMGGSVLGYLFSNRPSSSRSMSPDREELLRDHNEKEEKTGFATTRRR